MIADEDFPLDLKQGTPWTSNHGAGGRCSHLGSRKNLPNGVVRQDEGLGGGADERASGGPLLCCGRALCSKGEEENTPRRMHVKFYKFIL